MRYRVTHITNYRYEDSVPLCHNMVHLHPRDTLRQTCLSNEISVLPEPALRHDRVDFYGNFFTWFALQEPHRC